MTANENIVKLDIGGTVFKTSKSTLTRYDGFFKTMLETDVPVTKDESGAIFIDRDPKHFRLILNFMRDGHVAIPKSEEDIQEIKTEAQYYLLDGLVELCEMKNRQVNVNKCRYLDNEEDIVNAYISSTKKGVIVIYYPLSNIDTHMSQIASTAEKYGDEFDVYFSKSEIKKHTYHFCHVRRKSDGEVDYTELKGLPTSIKRLFPNENST